MVEVTIRKSSEGVADFDLPAACPGCSGDVAVRLTPEGAHSYCARCRWFSRPQLDFSRGSLSVAFPAGGHA